MSLAAAETKHETAQEAADVPAANIPAQDAAEPTTHPLQHRLPTSVWSRILLALPLQQQDQLRFECKKFHRALKPTLPCWVLVRTPQGEANKSDRDDPEGQEGGAERSGHVVSSLGAALAVFGRFRKAHPFHRFEIRLAEGRHTVDGDMDAREKVKDLPVGGGCYKGLRYCRGANLCVTSSEIYALCGEDGVEFVKLLPGTDVLTPEAFGGCRSLTSVSFPEGLQQVGDRAFSRCSSLTSVTFPEGLQQVGDRAFKGCTSLTSVTLPQGCSYTESGEYSSFPHGCSVVVQ